MAYRLLYPMRTYLLVSGRINREVNVMTADWVTVVSAQPFIIAVSVAPSRYSYGLITKYGEFVISVPSLEMLQDVWTAGTEHGPKKIHKTKFELIPGSMVQTPIIKNALANIECKVIGIHPYGDHVLFVGEVITYHYREDAFKDNEPLLSAGFIAHIARNKFTTFKEEIYTP